MPKPWRAKDQLIDQDYLNWRAEALEEYGWPKPKWISFCETLLKRGYIMTLHEASETVSKYITIWKPKSPIKGSYKVRFSNHKPNFEREAGADCDFFVGVTHLNTTTTEDALRAVRAHFEDTK